MFNYLFSYRKLSLYLRLPLFTLLILVLNISIVFGLDGNVDAGYTANALLPGSSEVVAVQPDGKILIGGAFAAVNGVARPSLVRLNTDGTIDTSFNPPTVAGSAGTILSLAIQPDGKILVGGAFRYIVNGHEHYGINRLNPDGSVDTTFGAGSGVTGGSGIYAIALQNDGKILIGGQFDRVDDVFKFNFARLNADGSLDSSVTTLVTSNFNSPIRRIIVQPNGQIIIGGDFNWIDGTTKYGIARLNSNGTLDNSFAAGTNPNSLVSSVERQTDGKLVLAGVFSQVNGVSKNRIARLNSDGTLDNAFTASLTNINGLPKARIQPDGKILLTGNLVTVNGVSKNNLARLNADGTLDNTFTASADNTTVDSVAGNSLIVIGFFTKLNDTDRFGVARLNSSGLLDTSFNAATGDKGKVLKLLAQPDGKTLVGGTFTHFANVSRKNIARLNADGTPDLSFNPGAGAGPFSDTKVNDIALSNDSKIAVGGNFSTFDGAARRMVVVLNPDGSRDTSFNPNFTQSGEIKKVVFYPGNKLFIVGSFRFGSETQFNSLALLNADGSRDTSFMPAFSGGGATSVAVQPDGKILVGGTFTSVNGVARNFIVRLNIDGSTDNSFNINTPGYFFNAVTDIIVQPDGKLLLSGYFPRTNDQFTFGYSLIRVNPNGSQDFSFNLPFLKSFYSTFALQTDGRILGFMDFRNPNENFSRRLVVRLRTNGSIDYSFNVQALGINVAYLMSTITVQADNKVLVGGDFPAYNNVPRLGIVALENSLTPAPAFFDFDGDGKSDISIFRPSNGEWWYLKSSDGGNAAFQFGNSSDKIAPADFTGDGKSDVAIFRPSTGEWFILRSENQSYYSFPFGTSGDVPAPADFDGDGITDPAVFRPSNSTWYINKSLGGTIIQQFGAGGDIPVAADYEGDGRADIAIYRPVSGEWWIYRSSISSTIAFQFGSSTDKPVVADYTGDGRADVAIWRPGSGEWFILRSEDCSYYSFPFGTNGDIPAPGDYDGDGKYDAAIFRPTDSTWYVQRSSAGTLIQGFGITGDQPVPSAFVP